MYINLWDFRLFSFALKVVFLTVCFFLAGARETQAGKTGDGPGDIINARISERLYRTTGGVSVYSNTGKIPVATLPGNALVVIESMDSSYGVISNPEGEKTYHGLLIPLRDKKDKPVLVQVKDSAEISQALFRLAKPLKVYRSNGDEIGNPYKKGDQVLVIDEVGKRLRVQKWINGRPSLERAWGLVNRSDVLVPVVSGRDKKKIQSKKPALKSGEKSELSKLIKGIEGGTVVNSSRSDCGEEFPEFQRVLALIREFHSNVCTWKSKEKNKRKALLERWRWFISRKLKKAKNREEMKGLLSIARTVDLVARTSTFESSVGGCSAKGICDRDLITISVRSRAEFKGHPGVYGGRFKGDYVGVSTHPGKYNVWSNVATKYQKPPIISCLLREEFKNSKMGKMFRLSLDRTYRILYSSGEDLSRMFKGVKRSDLENLRHYYHPPRMGRCDPTIYNKMRQTSATIKVIDQKGNRMGKLPAGSYIVPQKKAGDRFEFVLYKRSIRKGNREVWIKKKDFPGGTIHKDFIRELRFACLKSGIPDDCKRKGKTYRKMPRWVEHGKRLKVTCVNSQGTLETCRGPLRDEGEKPRAGGDCNEKFMLLSGVK